MRLSTLVLAVVVAGSVGGMAFANDEASPVAVADSQQEAVASGDALTPEDAAALGDIAPEAVAAEPLAADPEPLAAEPTETEPLAAEPMEAEPLAEAPVADAPVAQAGAPDESVTWEDFEDPTFDPSQAVEATPAAASAPAAKVSAKAAAIPLGPMGVDADGIEGRIHTVSSGETLWDISEAYLGTPWVWPSVWHENGAIDNPHRIEPGNRIWITSSEMRRISDAEADQMVAAVDDGSDDGFEFEPEPEPYEDDELIADEPLPASVEDEPELPVTVPLATQDAMTGEIIVLPAAPEANFGSVDLLEDAPTIVDAPTIRAFLTQGDEVYLALGEGEVQVGDEYEIFRDVVKIRDTDSRAVLGYHYDELGWLRITKVEGESSTAVIDGAYGDIERGDHLVKRNHPPREVAVRNALEEIDGTIVFTPGIRWMRGQTDSVYLNVGSIHGVEVGTHMQAIDRGVVKNGAQMPDTVIGQLVVVDVEAETAVAYITESDRELEIGDHVRGVMAADQFAAH